MLNHIVLMGRIVRKPEVKNLQDNLSVARYTVAVERDSTGKQTEKVTDFIECVSWRKQAEFVGKYFDKGSMIAVSGRLQLRDWTDKDGDKHRSAEVVTDNIYFCESNRKSGSNDNGQNTDSAETQTNHNTALGDNFEFTEDDELPFK